MAGAMRSNDDSPLSAPPFVTITYLGGLFNGEQARVPTPKGDVQIRRAQLVRVDHRAKEAAPLTFVDETYRLIEVAPGWWVALHDSIRGGP